MQANKFCNYYTCSPEIKNQLESIVSVLSSLLKTNLLGIYLSGSIVLDAFDEKGSDLDIIVVVQSPLTILEKIEVISYLMTVNRNPCRIDLDIVTTTDVENWQDMPETNLFFNDYWARHYERILAAPEDTENAEKLLAAVSSDGEFLVEFKQIKESGICLYGLPIDDLFPEIPDEIFLKSISSGIDGFYVESENDSQSSYLILTLCRILSFKATGMIMSKPKAAAWALDELPGKYHPVIRSAMYKRYGLGGDAAYTADDAISFKVYVARKVECEGILLKLLQKRYSCRNFSDKKIPADIIDYMLECGRLSASGGNDQPWKFGVVTDADIIKKISEAASVNYSQKWIANAPLVIVLCTIMYEIKDSYCMDRFPSLRHRICELDNDLYTAINMEEHQTKIPGEHMVLAALEHGIQSTWVSHVDCETVGELIGAEGCLVTNVIAFGYPQQPKEPMPKKELSEITFFNHFKNTGGM